MNEPEEWRGDAVVLYMAAIVVLLILLAAAAGIKVLMKPPDPALHVVQLYEKGSDALLAYSDSPEIGTGEVLLVYDWRLEVMDADGNALPFSALASGDLLEVRISGTDTWNEWMIDRIRLLGHADE